jgi:hypothetical protein
MSGLILESVLVCSVCGFAKREVMPTDSCQFSYKCFSCKTLLRPKSGDSKTARAAILIAALSFIILNRKRLINLKLKGAV